MFKRSYFLFSFAQTKNYFYCFTFILKVIRDTEIKQKKKLEGDINELEIELDHSNRANADLQKLIKKLIKIDQTTLLKKLLIYFNSMKIRLN